MFFANYILANPAHDSELFNSVHKTVRTIVISILNKETNEYEHDISVVKLCDLFRSAEQDSAVSIINAIAQHGKGKNIQSIANVLEIMISDDLHPEIGVAIYNSLTQSTQEAVCPFIKISVDELLALFRNAERGSVVSMIDTFAQHGKGENIQAIAQVLELMINDNLHPEIGVAIYDTLAQSTQEAVYPLINKDVLDTLN